MWKDDLEKQFPLLMKAFYALAALVLVLLAFKVAFTYMLPFVIALLMAAAMEPFVRFLVKRRLPHSAAVGIAMVVYFGVLFAAGFFAVNRLVTEVIDLSRNIPDYSRTFSAAFQSLATWGKKMYLQLPKEAVGPLQDSIQSLSGHLTRFLASMAGSVISVLTSMPELLMFAMFTIIATFFASRDRHVFKKFLVRQMPPPTYAKLVSLKDSLGHSLAGFLKAQLMLMTLTFSECFFGLSIIGIPYALIISLFIAVVDILPVLGTGTVLVPWGAICLAMGKTTTGVALLALYLVIMVVRYIVEPKILGTQLGLHPLLALIAMFVGLKALGVAGLILGPAIVVTVQAFMKSGLLPQLKE